MTKTYEFPNYQAVVDDTSLGVVYNGLEWFRLPLSIAVGSDDEDTSVAPLSVEEADGTYSLLFQATGSRWAEKIYSLFLAPDGISLKAHVVNDQDNPAIVNEIQYCNGTKYEACGYIYPHAQHASRRSMYREITEPSAISIHYLAPPLYSFPFVAEATEGSVAIGVGAVEGQYNFNEFRYVKPDFRNGKPIFRNGCGFTLPYVKPRKVTDEWDTPCLIITFGSDEIASLSSYADWHYNRLGCRKNPTHTSNPRWWRGPYFCGWSEQRAQADALGLNVTQKEAARQDVYEEMSRRIDELGLKPTAIIIDDKWQEDYGTLIPDKKKWPDLRGFVDAQHAKGRKVILWYKLWSSEGLPVEETATLFGTPLHTDPTNPAYCERVKKAIYTLLSSDEGCYDCDGFKIDFLSAYPANPHTVTYDNDVFGVELLKKNLELIKTSAKAVKADALINCSSCHPYFAETVDQSRLHDLSSGVRNSVSCMTWRRDLFHAAMPDILVDTDEGGRGSRADVLNYMRKAPTLGAPVLYWLTPSRNAPVTEDDWAERRAIWEAYSAEQDKLYPEENK